ncbi:MAG: PaaI family thioesterase [Solirubrobacteraceae bacterium]
MPPELPFSPDHGFDLLYGLVLTEVADDLLRGTVEVRDALKQPAGLIHGGVYASIAESLASTGTALGVARDGNVAQGLSNQTSFLRPILAGTIHATARARHRGRTTWVWEAEAADDAGRVCALTRVTVAVRPAPPGVDVRELLDRWPRPGT